MKKIFTLSIISFVTLLFFAGCRKDHYVNVDESYWLSRERGEVVYSDSYCTYYVVETANGYSVVRSYGGYKLFEGSILYGDFSYTGTHDIYNRSSGIIFTGSVTDYWLSYFDAQDAIDYYCPLGKTIKKPQKDSLQSSNK